MKDLGVVLLFWLRNTAIILGALFGFLALCFGILGMIAFGEAMFGSTHTIENMARILDDRSYDYPFLWWIFGTISVVGGLWATVKISD